MGNIKESLYYIFDEVSEERHHACHVVELVHVFVFHHLYSEGVVILALSAGRYLVRASKLFQI